MHTYLTTMLSQCQGDLSNLYLKCQNVLTQGKEKTSQLNNQLNSNQLKRSNKSFLKFVKEEKDLKIVLAVWQLLDINKKLYTILILQILIALLVELLQVNLVQVLSWITVGLILMQAELQVGQQNNKLKACMTPLLLD